MNSDAIGASYSADRIGCAQPVRSPFRHNGELWICTSISGSGLTESGRMEHEAYRIIPVGMFSGTLTTYSERTATDEASEAARNDPNGFYHGMTVKYGRETFVLSGPPVRFASEEETEPEQMALFGSMGQLNGDVV